MLQQYLKDFDKTFNGYFDKKQLLKNFHQGLKIENNQVHLQKLGWFSFRKHSSIQGLPKNIAIPYKSGHWHISIKTEQKVANIAHKSKSMVEIDTGFANFATLSTSEVIKSLS